MPQVRFLSRSLLMSLSPQEAAIALLQRKEVRSSLRAWVSVLFQGKGMIPAKHHELLLEKLQSITDGTLKHSKTGKPCRNLIISMPRGSAKSTYASVAFPPWAIQERRALLKHPINVLACSHTAELIEGFSGKVISAIDNHKKVLGYSLSPQKRGISKWATTEGDEYLCRGVGAGVVGFRGDIGVIDDYFASHEDASSKTIRDKRWEWYISDFWGCLKPDAIQIIVATRWHEEDLIGRLLDPTNQYNSPTPAEDWEEIRIPYIAEEDDCLGRSVGERLWPEYYNDAHEKGVRAMPPRIFSGMYQQRPAPEDGDYFTRDMLRGYTQEDLDRLQKLDLPVYGAGDWACSTEKDSDLSCFGGAVVGPDNLIYILPDITWGKFKSDDLVNRYVEFLKRRNPLMFWSEKGQISKSWGPFLKKIMLEEHVYNHITEVTPSKDKETRAQSIRGMMSMQRVRFPLFASWWEKAEHELLMFPGGKHDDFIDFLAHLGRGIQSMLKGTIPQAPVREDLSIVQPITMTWIKKSHKAQLRHAEGKYKGR